MDGTEQAKAPASSMAPLLQTSGLTKDFRDFRAVDGVDLRIAEGTIHALVGPNGAGQTPLCNLLTGCLHPTPDSIIHRGTALTGNAPDQNAHPGLDRSLQFHILFAHLSGLAPHGHALTHPPRPGTPYSRHPPPAHGDGQRPLHRNYEVLSNPPPRSSAKSRRRAS